MPNSSLRESSIVKNAPWQLLVVDDEKELADFLATVLRKDGYNVRTAYSGREALEQLREMPAHLVMTDMVMPKMDGMQLLAHIKEMYADTDVILTTGYGTIEDAVEAMRRGAADFLTKPFRANDVQKIIASCLRAKQDLLDTTFQKQSKSLIELTHLLARSRDIHTIPVRAAELAQQSFNADSIIILRYDPTNETVSVLSHAGDTVSTWGQAEKIAETALEAIRKPGPVLSADVSNADCHVFVPLMVMNVPRGVLCLRRIHGPWFHEKTVELLEIFAGHLALALESVRLCEAASQQVSELDEMITISRSLSLNTDPQAVCAQLLRSACAMTPADLCAVLVVNGGEEFLYTEPSLPTDSALHEEVRDRLRSLLQKTDNEITPSTKSARPSSETLRRLASFISAPLTGEGTLLGTVAAFSSRPECFSVEHIRQLAILAANAATAMGNASTLMRFSAMYHESIEMLGRSIDARYLYAKGHSTQVRTYSSQLARALGLDSNTTSQIEDGALLHDIGKICIPDTLLNKLTPLTTEEFAIIAAHPVHGANMLRDKPFFKGLIPTVRHHHEHYNGLGYPDGLRGEQIPIGARIVAIADVFDALISHRIYRAALDTNVARNLLSERANTQFDPEMVKAFLSLPLEQFIEY